MTVIVVFAHRLPCGYDRDRSSSRLLRGRTLTTNNLGSHNPKCHRRFTWLTLLARSTKVPQQLAARCCRCRFRGKSSGRCWSLRLSLGLRGPLIQSSRAIDTDCLAQLKRVESSQILATNPANSKRLSSYADLAFFQARHASVDHSAHATNNGWKNKRTKREVSELRPNASVRVTYCEMFPGNMATKKAATIQPTTGRHLRGVATNAAPRPSSTTPDETTTKSESRGSHCGT